MAKSLLLSTIPCTLPIFILGSVAHSVDAKPAFTGFGEEVDSYIRLAANRYQISERMLRGLVKFENGWTGKTSPTGATGVGQFTVGTWNWLAETDRGQQLGMRLITKYNQGTNFDPRHNKYINTLATALLARWHIEQFADRQIPVNDENLYMAHNIGVDGLHRALLGISSPEDKKNMRKNGMKPWMTVNDFIAYQKRRYTEHKYEANFQLPLPPKNVVANAKISTSTAIQPTHKKYSNPIQKPVHLSLPAKIRYVESHTPQLKWVEPNDKNVIWVDKTVNM